MKRLCVLLALLLPVSAQAQCGLADDEGAFIEAMLRADPEGRFDAVLKNAEEHRLQILVGEIVQNAGDRCVRVYGYRLGAEYYYPGSALKVIGAIGALMALREAGADPDTELTVEPRSIEGPRGKSVEVSSGTKEPTDLESILRQTIVVSSNGAFNRLYDIAGQARLNQIMWDAGLKSVRMRHRLAMQGLPQRSYEEVPRVVLHTDAGDAELHPAAHWPAELPPNDMPGLEIGVAYIDEATGERVEGPMGFAHKNAISLLDLHHMLVDIVDPELSGDRPRFALEAEDRSLLRSIMSESAWPTRKKTSEERDTRYKPLMPGVLAAGFERDEVVYTSKAGRAFGFHVVNAFIEHPETGRSVFVAATIYANDNAVMNDSSYPYSSVTYPFLQSLGEVVAKRFLVER